jgi:hypothetical protein
MLVTKNGRVSEVIHLRKNQTIQKFELRKDLKAHRANK